MCLLSDALQPEGFTKLSFCESKTKRVFKSDLARLAEVNLDRWHVGQIEALRPHSSALQWTHIDFASSSNEDVVAATPELTVFAFAEFAAKCTFFFTLCRYNSDNCKNSNALMKHKCAIL